jgi:hypothetical protein
MSARGKLRGPKRFASPAQAQLWFEWRRSARGLCFLVAALALVPVAIHLLVRVAAGLGPLVNNTMYGFTLYLVAVPLAIHLCFAASPDRTNLPFLLARPLTDGQMVMALLKAAALSAAFSWLAVLVALGAMPLLGEFSAVERIVSDLPEWRAAYVLVLIFLTWRIVAIDLCFVLSGHRWLAGVQVVKLVAVLAAAMLFALGQNGAFRWFVPFIPGLLACLVAVKLLLACVAFRVSLQRRLLAPSALFGYLAVWLLLVAALLALVVILPRPSKGLVLPLSLGVVLFVPLARIGFCPIALARSRHT